MIKFLYFRVVLLLSLLVSATNLFAQNTIPTQVVCDNSPLENIETPTTAYDLNLRSTCTSSFTQRWVFIVAQVRAGTRFEFEICPPSGTDLDYLAWKNPPGITDYNNLILSELAALPPADRGNFNAPGAQPCIGMRYNDPDICVTSSGDGYTRHFDVVPGDIVLIAITNHNNTNVNINTTFGGDAVLDCYVGKSFYECVNEETNLATFDLESYVEEVRPPGTNSAHFFYESQEAAERHLPSERITNPIVSIPYTPEGKDIFVRFQESESSSAIVKFSLRPLTPLNTTKTLLYGCFQGENPMTHVALGLFNLKEIFPPEYLTDQLISKKIFRTRANAEANGTAGLIAAANWEAYNAAAGTVYVRLEYDFGTDKKCVKIIPVVLEIVRVELANAEVNRTVCYDELIDLTQFQTEIVTATNDYDYSYSIDNVLITNPSEFVVSRSSRIKVAIGKGSCTEYAYINLDMAESPYIEFWSDIIVCDNNFDGSYEVDLGNIRNLLLESTGNYTYSFYLNEDDARNQVNEINTTIANIPEGQQLIVRANSDTHCYSIGAVPLVPGEAIEFTAPTVALEECITIEGITTFDISEVIPSLALAADVTYKVYPSAEDAYANTNEITAITAWSTNLTEGSVYIKLTQEDRCDKLVPVEFRAIEAPEITILENVEICEGTEYVLDLSAYQDYTFTISGSPREISPKVYGLSTEGTYVINVVNQTGCQSTYNLVLDVIDLPVFTPFTAITLCDDNFDGQYEVDLVAIKTLAQANVGANFLIKLFATEADAIAGTNELTVPYSVTTLPSKVWIKASTAQGDCFVISSIDLVANTAVTFTAITQPLEICAQPNGTEVFNLTSVLPQLNLAAGSTVKYYTSLTDANNNINAIVNTTAWAAGNASGTIYLRIEKEGLCPVITSFTYQVNALPEIFIDSNVVICEGEEYILDLSAYTDYTFVITGGAYRVVAPNKFAFNTTANYQITVSTAKGCTRTYAFNVVSNPLPKFTAVRQFGVCDANVDGIFELDLVALSNVVLVNNAGITLTYYRSETELLAGINPIFGDEYLTTLPSSIWVKATTAAGCFDYISVNLVQGNSVSVRQPLNVLQVCRNIDGTSEFDLSLMRSQFNVPDGYILSYYNSLADLQNGVNEILNPTVWTTRTIAGTIYVKFEAAGLCPGYSKFDYVSNPLPVVTLKDKYFICEGEEYLLDLSNYDYNIRVIGNSVVALGNNKFKLSTLGTYNVIATSQSGCISEYSFDLKTYQTPIARDILIGTNTITVNLLPNVDYVNVQYSLDGVNFQSSHVLNIPQRGVDYDIWVKIGDCIFYLDNVQVINIPTFFSPNNDGSNDTWKIRPSELRNDVYVKIYDRYGKTVYEQKGNQDIIWDGKVAGKALPSTDYWYMIEVGSEGSVKTIRYSGSITLKNKN